MGTEPASVDALVAWLKGHDGPGIAFAKGLDEQLRSEAEVLKGPAPTSFEEYHAARVWDLVSKASDISLDGLDISADSYKADKPAWWSDQGMLIIERVVQSTLDRRGGHTYGTKEATGKLLTGKEYSTLARSKEWKAVRTLISSGEMSKAIRKMSGDSKTETLMMRAFLYIHSAVGVTPKNSEVAKQEVFDTLRDLDEQVCSAIKGAIQNAYTERLTVSIDFVHTVREALAEIAEPKKALQEGLKQLLGCGDKDLHSQSFKAMELALQTVVGIWFIMMGTRVGKNAERNVIGPLSRWGLVDSGFVHWQRHSEQSAPSPYALVTQIIEPRLSAWMETVWEFLRSGDPDDEPEDTLGDYFAPRMLMREHNPYFAMDTFLQDLKRNPGRAAVAAASQFESTRDRDNGRDQDRDRRRHDRDRDRDRDRDNRGRGGKWCKFCENNGKADHQCRHHEADCFHKNGKNKRPRDGKGGDGNDAATKKYKDAQRGWRKSGKCLKCGSSDHRRDACDKSGPGAKLIPN